MNYATVELRSLRGRIAYRLRGQVRYAPLLFPLSGPVDSIFG